MKLSANSPSIIALSGGIGGAKLALGLSRFMPQEQLLIVGNTGDDFEHLGLHISPDLDTLMYTLSGKADTKKGWDWLMNRGNACKPWKDWGVKHGSSWVTMIWQRIWNAHAGSGTGNL